MEKIWAVIYYTFRESLARKTFITFFIISTITLLFLLFAVNLDIVDGALVGANIFGGEVRGGGRLNLEDLMLQVETALAGFIHVGGVFFAIFATASLVPNMLQKGNIDWLLSKPLARHWLLTGRALGAIAIVAFNVLYFVFGTWLIISMKTGVWHFEFLQSGFLIIFIFSIVYSFMVLLGVLIQNSAVSIMGAFVLIGLGSFLAGRDQIYAVLTNKFYQILLDGLYYATPRLVEMGKLATESILRQPSLDWSPIWHSLIVGVGYFALAIIAFKRKNF